MAKLRLKKINPIVIVVIILSIIVFTFIDQDRQKMKVPIFLVEPEWQIEYKVLVEQEGIDGSHLIETPYYDFSSTLIQNRIAKVMLASDNSRQYIQNAAELVFIEIAYNIQASDVQCISGKASTNILAGEGDCTEQGMTLIALLRGAGIPARAVGGCLFRDRSTRCDLFAAVPFKQPRYKELTKEDLEQGILSRRQVIGSRKGGLHLYIEAWIPDEEIKDGLILDDSKKTDNGAWIIIEPTTGEIVKEDSCFLYDEEFVVPNDRKDLYCATNNLTYAIFCSTL